MADPPISLAPEEGKSIFGDKKVVNAPPRISGTAMYPEITLRSPKKYNPQLPTSTAFSTPPLEWLEGTWSVTHSTLPMWRNAKNVRITYKMINPESPTGIILLDDLVTSVPTKRTWLPQPRSIKGIDKPDGEGAWNWRGRGWLRIARSHWEVLGWGNAGEERWVVTWFAPTLFTPAGLDIYCNNKDGISHGLYNEIHEALKGLEATELADLARDQMREVLIAYD